MRKINKSKEPKEWTEYRLTPNADYQAIPELRTSLLEEQGYICAYCMRRIPTLDGNSNETTRIEHVLSREKHPDLRLNYTNMVICCPGAISADGEFHCDKLKGDNDITFNLFDDQCFATISYQTKDGKIKSSNQTYDDEINNILNLNHRALKINRLSVLKGVLIQLQKHNWQVAYLKKTLENWSNKDKGGRFKPYCGIVEWFLKKKINLNK